MTGYRNEGKSMGMSENGKREGRREGRMKSRRERRMKSRREGEMKARWRESRKEVGRKDKSREGGVSQTVCMKTRERRERTSDGHLTTSHLTLGGIHPYLLFLLLSLFFLLTVSAFTFFLYSTLASCIKYSKCDHMHLNIYFSIFS